MKSDWYFEYTHACAFFLSSTQRQVQKMESPASLTHLIHTLTISVSLWGEKQRKMLRLTSPFSLSFHSISNPNLPSSFPRPSLHLPNSILQTSSLRINTPPPLSSSISSSVDQTTSISQVWSLNHTHIFAFHTFISETPFLLEFLTFWFKHDGWSRWKIACCCTQELIGFLNLLLLGTLIFKTGFVTYFPVKMLH